MKIILTAINAKYIHTNLAVRSIYEYCHNFKNHLNMVEFTINNDINYIISELYLQKPTVICFSCYIWNIDIVKKAISTLKKILPSVKIILGGPEVSHDTEHMKDADIIIIGEGEATFYEIVQKFLNGCDMNSIYQTDGISYIKDGEVFFTKQRRLLDMSELPFPYKSGLPDNKIIYYESSRGCPFNCGYCLSSQDNGVRFAPLNKVFEEINIFIENKVRQIKFVDRTFNCNSKRAYAIWEYLIKNDNNITNFHFEISADLLDNKQLTLLKTARTGLFQFEIGVQSTNKSTLDVINRETNLEKLFKSVSMLRSGKNIETHLDLIAGLPNEDFKSFKNSFNDVYSLSPEQLQLGFLKLLKGSDLRNNSEKLGIYYNEFPPYEITGNLSLDYMEIIKLKQVEEALNIYYNTNRYETTLKYVVPQFPSPFDFYESLSAYWYDNGYQHISHSKMRYFEILYEFLKLTMKDDTFLQRIKFDLYSCENVKAPPSWLKFEDIDNVRRTLYSDKNFIEKYIPHYLIKPMLINRLCNIEKFLFEDEKYYLFDYGERKKSVMFSNSSAKFYDITSEVKKSL